MFFGRGGYDWHTAYNMPIWLRKFTAKMIEQRITEEYEAQKKSIESSQGIQTATPENTRSVQMPEAVKRASYNTTVAKKQ